MKDVVETLYVVDTISTELPEEYEYDVGESQGVFNEAGELLDYWSLSDFDLREEYAGDLFRKLGYKIGGSAKEEFVIKLCKAVMGTD